MGLFTIIDTNITAVGMDTANQAKYDVSVRVQGYNSLDLATKQHAYVQQAGSTSAIPCCFANWAKTDIEIEYLNWSGDNDVWQYANVPAGVSVPQVLRAVRTFGGATFVAGQKLIF